MAGPLTGYRIVDLSAFIAGPIATMMLGDQGADVIKVEPPGAGDYTRAIGAGSGISAIFATANRNKRSIALNLKEPAGREVLKRLVSGADVFVQNFRPGTADRMGIGEPEMRAIRPELVYVSISGFGEKGPYAHKKVYDPVIQALSGLAAIQGDRVTGRPRMVRTIVPDKLTAVTAAQAITAALLARERTGVGQHLRLAMLDAMISFLWPEGMANHTFIRPEEDASRVRPRQVRDLVFETADGFMTAGVVSDSEWTSFARAAGRPEWLDDPRFKTATTRMRHWDERLELMGEAIKLRKTEEWLRIFDEAQVPCAPILGRRELLTHPQIQANEIIVEGNHPHVGPMRQTRPAARFEGTPAEIRQPAPLLGEHTDEILTELGCSPAEIGSLRSSGAVS